MQAIDYSKLTWVELAGVIRSVWLEMKNRNPIGINAYEGHLATAFDAVLEIAEGEQENPTSENGVCSTCGGDKKIMASTGNKKHPLKAIPCPTCVPPKKKGKK